jgi:hypothetical protein
MKIKKDRYRKSRGGTSQVYELKCCKCGAHLLRYQKDGVGTLLRLYIDRIVEPIFNPNSNLVCSNCGNLIGIPMIYKAEDRAAFRLIRGSYSKSKFK